MSSDHAGLLQTIEACHGKEVRDEAARLLEKCPTCVNPFTLVRLAKRQLYGEQLQEVAANAVRSFDSDGDL